MNAKPSYDEQVKILTQDLIRAKETGDMDLYERSKAEYYNLITSKAKKEGDKISLYLLALLEELNEKKMYGAASLINALILFHKAGQLDSVTGFYLAPIAAQMSSLIVELAQEEMARRRRGSE